MSSASRIKVNVQGHRNGSSPNGAPHIDPKAPETPHIKAAAIVLAILQGKRVSRERIESLPASPIDWSGAAIILKDTAEADRRPKVLRAWVENQTHLPAAIRDMMHKALGGAEGTILDPEEAEDGPKAKRFSLELIGSAAFAKAEYPREWLIEDIAVRDKPGVVGGPKKALKTSTMVDFVISLASATPFLGQFPVPRPTRTMFLSGESGGGTIQETARRVCLAKGIDLEELEGNLFWGFVLPKLSDQEQLEVLAEAIREHKIEVVVIDPLYLCLLSTKRVVDPANLFDVGPLLALVSETCLRAGATPFLVHHLRKSGPNNPYTAPELEDLAYAGVQEFARQWILISRREAYQPGSGEHDLWLSIGGSDGQSGLWALAVSEGVIDKGFGGRRWQVAIRPPSEARDQATEQSKQAKAEQQIERKNFSDEIKARSTADDAGIALGKLRQLGKATKTSWRDSIPMSGTRFGPAFEHLISSGLVVKATIEVPNGDKRTRPIDGFQPSPTGPNLLPFPDRDRPGQTTDVPVCPGHDPGDRETGTGWVSLPVRETPISSPGLPSGSYAIANGPGSSPQGTHKSPGQDDVEEGHKP
jgi:hypothetical protein